jgi:hypothetical protein
MWIFGNGYLVVRGGKGDKDRFAPLPESLKDALRAQIEVARERWTKDRAMGVEGVFLPEALSVKYVNEDKDWKWFWLFPSPDLSDDPWTKKIRRHHLNVNGVQQLVKCACTNGRRKSQSSAIIALISLIVLLLSFRVMVRYSVRLFFTPNCLP